jgi:ssDNA-binding replication factor A large subunit
MHKTQDQLYEIIKDLKTKDDFKEEIKKISNDCDKLFDEDTIALLIVDELGRNKQTISKIVELKPDADCTVFGTVTNIRESRNFTRKNGSSGAVVNLELSDETGSCGLVLWNDDVKLVKNKTIQKGTHLKVINGYIKDGFNGLELNVGRWGLLEIEPEDMTNSDNKKLLPDEKEIHGTLVEIKPTNAFFKDSGEIGFVTKIKIKDKDTVKTLTLWDEKVKEIQIFHVGDVIKIDNFDIRNNNGKAELHVNGRSTIRLI